MAFIYDSECKRVTDEKSGLAVEFVVEVPHLGECEHRFKLIWQNKETPFHTIYDFGYEKVRDQYPDLSPGELLKESRKLAERNFHTSLDMTVVKKMIADPGHDVPQIFVEVLHHLLIGMGKRDGHLTKRLSVFFSPFFNPAQGKWSVEE